MTNQGAKNFLLVGGRRKKDKDQTIHKNSTLLCQNRFEKDIYNSTSTLKIENKRIIPHNVTKDIHLH